MIFKPSAKVQLGGLLNRWAFLCDTRLHKLSTSKVLVENAQLFHICCRFLLFIPLLDGNLLHCLM